MAAHNDARIWGVVGASGTGKGVWIKQKLREDNPPRLIAWDFKAEYGEFAKQAPTLDAVRRAMIAAGNGPLRMRYVPRGAGEKALRAEFEALCELVYAFGHCTFIAEELANVTTPGWAPAAWRKMTTSGRHEAVHIIGATQSPALVDKSFLGNCTLIHCCALREHLHRVAVARSMDIDPGRIAALVKLQWIEKDFDTGEVRDGWVTVPGKKQQRAAPTPTEPSPTPTGAPAPGREPPVPPKVRASSTRNRGTRGPTT
ncbi:MAG TPA: hypothetical protein VNO84_11615 [Burkholderiaceae bacterium]|nr:hypothetical protein [Burkholderiaceae bacterium]